MFVVRDLGDDGVVEMTALDVATDKGLDHGETVDEKFLLAFEVGLFVVIFESAKGALFDFGVLFKRPQTNFMKNMPTTQNHLILNLKIFQTNRTTIRFPSHCHSLNFLPLLPC